MAPITQEERDAILQEVEDASERTTIDKDNVQVYFKISTKGKEVAWFHMICKKCAKPLYVHTEECTLRVRIAEQKTTLYNTAMMNSEMIKQEMHWAIVEAGLLVKDNNAKRKLISLSGKMDGLGKSTRGRLCTTKKRRQESPSIESWT